MFNIFGNIAKGMKDSIVSSRNTHPINGNCSVNSCWHVYEKSGRKI